MEQVRINLYIATSDTRCDQCNESIKSGAIISHGDSDSAICLSCADMDHLVFLPSGDAALTRRAGKYSGLSAVVLKWVRRHKRYQRQGTMVEEAALARAEEYCLKDSGLRAERRKKDALRRLERDKIYVEQFGLKIRELFPGCPENREILIAQHTCLKYSDRVGRTKSAKDLNEKAVKLAVAAHIRHTETNYDKLLSLGVPRRQARAEIQEMVKSLMLSWAAA